MSALRTIVFCPAFDEAPTVGRVVKEIHDKAPAVDVLVVDDGSTDATSAVAREAGATVITRKTNGGILAASMDAFGFARDRGYDVLIQVDADGQHDPTEIPQLLAPIQTNASDIVIGSRFLSEDWRNVPRWRAGALRFLGWMTSLASRYRVTDTTTGFRAYGRKTFDPILKLRGHIFIDGLALIELEDQGIRVMEVAGALRARQAGHSHYNLRSSTLYVMRFLWRYFLMRAGIRRKQS